ncbi:ArnT family glycosyltransferase [Paenibacillus sp. 1P03SA]|uniref:ArnT family glycosyltransferase n=1 Tax=Paenibacillus sp. 1P03SA TaxID=3132294 RepID=UPI0039A06787
MNPCHGSLQGDEAGRTRFKWIYLILLSALVLRLVYIFSNSFPPPVGDAMFYSRMANQFLETGILGYNQTEPNAYVTPGFPLLLSAVYAMFGADPLGFQLTQVAFSVLTVWVVYRIARKYLSETFSLIGAACMAVYPSFIYANGLLLTEATFTLLLASFLLVLLEGLQSGRRSTLTAAGVLLGMSVLVRPTPAVLVLPLAVYFARKLPSRKLIVQALMYVGFSSFIVVLPWWIRNFLLYGEPVLFSTSGNNPLLWGVHPYLIGWENTFQSIYQLNPSELERNALWGEKAKEMFQSQLPQASFIEWFLMGKLNSFWKIPWVENGEIAHLLEKWRNPLHLLIVAGGWLGLTASVLRKHSIALLALVVVVYTVMHQIMLPIPRYAYPIMPYIIILFCFGMNLLYDAANKRVKKANRHAS